MLDQLVESKSNAKENRTRGGYLLTTFALVAGLCLSAVLWSLYAKDLGMGREEFELSTVIAPILIPENVPAPLQKEQPRVESPKTKTEIITRQTNTLRIEESPLALNKVSVAPNTQKSRPNGNFLVRDGLEAANENSSSSINGRRETGSNKVGISGRETASAEVAEKTTPPPPPIKKPAIETVEKRKPIISTGVVNGQATSLPKPPYPPTAKAVNAGGNVNVQVTIDETGKVISAKAIDGHLLLRAAAEKAAWSAKFKPTLLSNQPVKVTGVIVYKFSAQ